MSDSPHDLAAKIGRGVQLFRIRNPKRHFEQVADLGGLPEATIGGRRVWKLRDTDIYFALLTIPYKDEEDLLVRAEGADWDSWDWSILARIADECRWRGPQIDERWIN
jgi:hypothetical protein